MLRAQAAIELLMSYGWAIIIATLLIFALAYYGVLDPSRLFPARCVLSEGLSCSDAQATAHAVKLRIHNSGEPLIIRRINITADILQGTCSNPFQAKLNTGESKLLFTVGCDSRKPLKALRRATVVVDYLPVDSALSHTAHGELLMKGDPRNIIGEGVAHAFEQENPQFWAYTPGTYSFVQVGDNDMALELAAGSYLIRSAPTISVGQYVRIEFNASGSTEDYPFYLFHNGSDSFGFYMLNSDLYGFRYHPDLPSGRDFTLLIPATRFKNNTWYIAYLKADSGLGMYAEIYERDNVTNTAEYASSPGPAPDYYTTLYAVLGKVQYNDYFESSVIAE